MEETVEELQRRTRSAIGYEISQQEKEQVFQFQAPWEINVATYVANSEVTELLALIRNVIVPHTKCPRNSCVLDGGANEHSDTLADGLAYKIHRGNLRRLQAVGLDLDNLEKVIVLTQVMVHGVADARVENQGQECAKNGQEPDDLVLVTPPLPSLVEDGQKGDAGEADGAREATRPAKVREDVVDLAGSTVGRNVRAEQRAHLVQQDCDGHSRDEPGDDGDGDEFQQEAELQETQDHAKYTH